jgi:pilus assembly protein CpaF
VTGPGAQEGVSPLVEIERAVQERAKDISLEMSAPGGEAKLRALIGDEVARWNDDHRRGRRTFGLPDPALVVERAFRNLARYGPLTPLLADDDVWEIMLNAPDALFVRRHRGPSGYHDEVFHDDDHVLRTLTKLLDDASTAHRKLDPAEGLQDAQLDSGARVHIVHGDIARGGHVIVNIRKFTGIPFKSLGELVERDMLSTQAALFLRACVHARLSIVFAGPPGSGKTTLLSCTTAELDPGLRVVVAEEVFESDVPVPNVAQMQTRTARADRPAIDLRRLVAGFLRMAPDVAIVGEVRDREGLPELRPHVDMLSDLGRSVRHRLAGPTGGQSSVPLRPGEAICLPAAARESQPADSVAPGGLARIRHGQSWLTGSPCRLRQA